MMAKDPRTALPASIDQQHRANLIILARQSPDCEGGLALSSSVECACSTWPAPLSHESRISTGNLPVIRTVTPSQVKWEAGFALFKEHCETYKPGKDGADSVLGLQMTALTDSRISCIFDQPPRNRSPHAMKWISGPSLTHLWTQGQYSAVTEAIPLQV